MIWGSRNMVREKSKERPPSEGQSIARKDVKKPRGIDIVQIAKNVSCMFLQAFLVGQPRECQACQICGLLG